MRVCGKGDRVLYNFIHKQVSELYAAVGDALFEGRQILLHFR